MGNKETAEREFAQALVKELQELHTRLHGKEIGIVPTQILFAAKHTIEELLRQVAVLETEAALREPAPQPQPQAEPVAWPSGRGYTVERHGNGWAIYLGRDRQHHGANLGQLTECGPELAAQIQAALNAAPQPQAGVVEALEELLDEAECWFDLHHKRGMTKTDYRVWLTMGRRPKAIRNARAALAAVKGVGQ